MSDHSHSTSPATAGHDDHDDVSSHVRTYLGVFLAVLMGTGLPVGLYFVHFQSMAVTITIALFIASIKAFLVAGYFMHLLSEKKMIYSVLMVTAVFFVGLAALTLWSSSDRPRESELKALYVP